MVLLDFILLAPLGFGLIRGFFNGLVKELVSVVAIILGLFAAYYYADPVEAWLADHIKESIIGLKALAYLLIFGSVLLAAFALSFLVTKLLQALALGLLNRVLGALFGLLKSLLILLVILHVLQPYLASNWSELASESVVYEYLAGLSESLGKVITDGDFEETIPLDSLSP